MLSEGLTEVLMEELKNLHTKLCMESLEQPPHHSKRSKVRRGGNLQIYI